MRRKVSVFAALLGAAILPASAGPAASDAGHVHGATSIGAPAEASAKAREVPVRLGDSFYDPKTIRIEAGETVRFVLTNTGELLHEFSIATASMHVEHRKEMQAMADAGSLTATDVDPRAAAAHDHANSVLIGPGATGELVWRFPQAAELQFACNLPGHYEAGMVGEFEFAR